MFFDEITMSNMIPQYRISELHQKAKHNSLTLCWVFQPNIRIYQNLNGDFTSPASIESRPAHVTAQVLTASRYDDFNML